MPELKNCKNFEELCQCAEEELKRELYSSPISNKEIYVPYDINYYARLCKLGFWVIDCEEAFVTISTDSMPKKDTSYGRAYIKGYIHRLFLETFNHLLTSKGYHICVHDHHQYYNDDKHSELGYVITNNQIIKDRMYGVLSEYTLTYDYLGQPKVEPVKYIKYDKYSLAKLKGYFTNNEMYEQLYDEYVEITILDKNFDNNKEFENDIENWLKNASNNSEDWSKKVEQYRIAMLIKKEEKKKELSEFWNKHSTDMISS
jgi:hypothetical protein